jgi:predicted enzyme related to lactoylglutathione lyase
MNSFVTHFEIYGEDPAKLADFYASLFGWQIEKAAGVDYWRIQTEAKSSGAFDGGLTYRAAQGPSAWLNYVTVTSVDAALAQAEQIGATIVRPKTAVPRTGWYAVLLDPQGNSFAIWQRDPTAFPPPPEPD